MPNSVVKRYTLTVGENTYSSPASINEGDARKLQSLIPSLSGALERERPTIPFTITGPGSPGTPFPSRIGFFYQFKRNNSGTIASYFFCATAAQLYQLISGVWVSVLPLAAFPVACTINNTMHLSDGVSSLIFDGISFVKDGLEIPLHAPVPVVNAAPTAFAITSITRLNGVVTVNFTGTIAAQRITIASTADNTFNANFLVDILNNPNQVQFNQAGLPDSSLGAGGTISTAVFTVLSNRYYWTTFSDQTTTHPHESSSSPISVGTGPFTGRSVTVNMRSGAGTVSLSAGSVHVVGSGTDFSQSDVGKGIYLNDIHFTIPTVHDLIDVFTIISVQDAQHLTVDRVAISSVTSGFPAVIAPVRATHWNIYASSSEEDKEGNLLASIQILANNTLTGFYVDQSPMLGTVGSYFQSVQRPLLNDPTPASTIMEVHKNRIFRNLLTFPNFFTYTGFEEILAEQAGTPSECVPGADPNTRSTGQINETSYPDQSSVINVIKKHGDALYIGTELNTIPLYGSSLADFQLSESQAFAVGTAGRRLACSTPFGFAFVSYDTKVYLYPSQYSFGVDSTTALVELGRPKRPEFEQVDGADYDNAYLVFYNYGRRNWLIYSYRRVDQTFATWVFDFETKGWFQLQQGYTAIAVFEISKGKKVLVGAAAADNKTYVLDDLTGTYPVPPGTNYPVGYFRSLLDFGDPNTIFVVHTVEYEKSDVNMEVDATIWLDPIDPENPGQGIPIGMTDTTLGANTFKGRPTSDTGASCQRVLVEFAVAASPTNGRFHGFTVEAEKTEDPVL